MRPSASTAARLLVVLLFVLSADMGEAKKKITSTDKKLTQAVKDGSLKAAKAAIKGGADVDRKFSTGSTILHKAAKAGEGAIVELLLAKGADASAKDTDGKLAADVATGKAKAAFKPKKAKAAKEVTKEKKAAEQPKAKKPAKKGATKPKAEPAMVKAAAKAKAAAAAKAKAAKEAAAKEAAKEAAAKKKADEEAAAAKKKAEEAAAAKKAAEEEAEKKKKGEEAAAAKAAAEKVAGAEAALAEKKAASAKEDAAVKAQEAEKAKADAVRKGPIGKIARHGSVRSGSALFKEMDSRKKRKVERERFCNVVKNLRIMEKAEAGVAFDTMDTNGDKLLTLRELLGGFSMVQEACTAPAPEANEAPPPPPPPPPPVTPLGLIAKHLARPKSRVTSGRKLYNLLDPSKTGSVTEDRFITLMHNMRMLSRDDGKKAFLDLDINYDDKLSMRELLHGLNNNAN